MVKENYFRNIGLNESLRRSFDAAIAAHKKPVSIFQVLYQNLQKGELANAYIWPKQIMEASLMAAHNRVEKRTQELLASGAPKIPGIEAFEAEGISEHSMVTLSHARLFQRHVMKHTDKLCVSHVLMVLFAANMIQIPDPRELFNRLMKEEYEESPNEPFKELEDDKSMQMLRTMCILAVQTSQGDEPDEDKPEIPTYLTVMEAGNREKPFIPRPEMKELIHCLARMDKPHAILVGEPGVGKTELVKGLVEEIAENKIPSLKETAIFSLDVQTMMSGAMYKGEAEARLEEALQYVKQRGGILFIDEIHTLVKRSSPDGASMSDNLKQALTERGIRVIGTTTWNEYQKYIARDEPMARRFQVVAIKEPTPEQSKEILNGLYRSYEKFHGVRVNKKALESAVDFSVKYLRSRFLPDKAIDVLDRACVSVKLRGDAIVKTEDAAEAVSQLTGIPVSNIIATEMEKVKGLDVRLRKNVFGQDDAVKALSRSVQMAKAGLSDPEKPIGSFLMVGPSGVGKTELAKQLAGELGMHLIRLDMSEYAERHTVAKLIGSPPGYIGYEDGGILVDQVRQHPNSVVLLDELEKAHPDIYKVLLQVMDYGTLTDSHGQKADFRNTVILMTSNAGNRDAETAKPRIGFSSEPFSESRESCHRNAVSEMLPPEFRGRLTDILVFNPMSVSICEKIAEKELRGLVKQASANGIKLGFTKESVRKIAEDSANSSYGARAVKTEVSNIRAMVLDKILSGATGSFEVTVKGASLTIAKVKQAPKTEKEPEKVLAAEAQANYITV